MESVKRFYVYTLAYPDGRVFYIGTGTGSRAYDHEKEARRKDCTCRRCKTIRRIKRAGKQVKIEFVFETDSREEAREHEVQLIHKLCKELHLCNRRGNPYEKNGPPLQEFEALTSHDDFIRYLDRLDIPKRKREQRLRDWAQKRLGELRWQQRTARRHRPELEQEIEVVRAVIGKAWQHRMSI